MLVYPLSGGSRHFSFLTLTTCCLLTSRVQPNPTCLADCACANPSPANDNFVVDCTSGTYADLPTRTTSLVLRLQQPEGLMGVTTVLLLTHNNITRFELAGLESWPVLRRLDLSRNRIKSVEGVMGQDGGGQELPLEFLSLSHNHIQVGVRPLSLSASEKKLSLRNEEA